MIKKRILLVDDEEGFTRLLKMNLEKTGKFDVMIENRSTKAALAAKLFHPDLILLDIVMPDMDGGDVASMIQSEPGLSQIPIVMLTALVEQDETSSGAVAQAGTLDVLAKPINMDVMMRCLEEKLGMSSG
tara:strand:+ start:7778 stop:8167 length:390 start_codon:yes stop_codon:yes gene_type:complete